MEALKIAEKILAYQNLDSSLAISNLKLQKLLFYCQAYHLVFKSKPLFDDDILAWDYGPVVEDVYEHYKKYKSSIIPPPKVLKSCIDASSIGIISVVMDAYAKMSPISLMSLTHSEKPWQQAYPNGVISRKSMQEYYKQFTNK